MTIEAMKLALEHIEGNYTVSAEDAIKALEEALAKQEQGEPVACCRVFPLRGDESIARHYIDWVNGPVAGDLYTTPQQRKPLTNEQIDEIADIVSNMTLVGIVNDFRTRFARAIEAAHGIKE